MKDSKWQHAIAVELEMSRTRHPEPFSCTVVVKLKKGADLEITTSAAHALAILSGETVIPPEHTVVRDMEGRPMTREQLQKLVPPETQ